MMEILTNKTALPVTASRDILNYLVKEALENKLLYWADMYDIY